MMSWEEYAAGRTEHKKPVPSMSDFTIDAGLAQQVRRAGRWHRPKLPREGDSKPMTEPQNMLKALLEAECVWQLVSRWHVPSVFKRQAPAGPAVVQLDKLKEAIRGWARVLLERPPFDSHQWKLEDLPSWTVHVREMPELQFGYIVDVEPEHMLARTGRTGLIGLTQVSLSSLGRVA